MPLDIKFNEDNSQSVYNHLSKWFTLIQESNRIDNEREERSSETREVLFEKFTPFSALIQQKKKVIKNWETSGLLSALRGVNSLDIAQLIENQASNQLDNIDRSLI